MLYVGLDIHVSHITGCVLNENGKVLQRWQVSGVRELVWRLEQLSPFEVCYEASTGYGTFFELLSKHASRVAVAHPGLLRLIFRSKQKNDRADAQKLAKLLYVGEVPEVHVPSADVRAWRELITFRRKVVEKRTRAKNGLRCVLRSLGIVVPKKPGLWSKKGLVWLRELEFSSPLHAVKRDLLVEEVDSLCGQIARIESELAKFSKDNPAVERLRTIPGVGLRTSEAVVAFIDDPHRFANSKKLGSYFGLVPSQDQSGSKNRLGHMTKEGSATVRHLVTEAVWQASRRSPTVRAYVERIARGEKERKKIAIATTTHYLVRVMWSMLKNGTVWKENEKFLAA